jgi:Family of unknown function (DUF6463)
MSITTTTTTTLSGHLLMGTGIVHCVFGLLVPELREPLVRIAREWAVIPRTTTTTSANTDSVISDHYERECAFWFQFGGVMMISQGYLLRHYCLETNKRPPRWFGWYLTLLGLFGVSVILMPASGFSLVLCQGVWLLLSSSSPIGNNGHDDGDGDPSSPQQQQQQRAK